MARIKTPEEYTYRWVSKSVQAYIEADKYNKKPQPLAWIIGEIKSAALPREDLERVFASWQDYPTDNQERRRLQAIKRECVKLGWLCG